VYSIVVWRGAMECWNGYEECMMNVVWREVIGCVHV